MYTNKLFLGISILALPYGSLLSALKLFELSQGTFNGLVFANAILQSASMVYLTNFREYHRENYEVAGPRNTNTFAVIKANGGTLTLTIFTVLDATLKERNGPASIIFCLSGFANLLLFMILFRIGTDYDLAGSFLSASFSLFYELSRDFCDVIYLFFVSCGLASVKAVVLEVKFYPPLPQLPHQSTR